MRIIWIFLNAVIGFLFTLSALKSFENQINAGLGFLTIGILVIYISLLLWMAEENN